MPTHVRDNFSKGTPWISGPVLKTGARAASLHRLGLEIGEIQYIERLANNVDAIKLWLSYYKEEGKKHGFLARGLRIARMAKNAAC